MFENLSENSVLFWSGGLRSTLLLAMLKESGKTFQIVQHRDLWTKEQKKLPDTLIKQWDLKLFSYPPATVNVIEGLTLGSIYAVNGRCMPIQTRLVEGKGCLLTKLQGMRLQHSPLSWDTHLVGIGQQERWSKGTTEFWAPLWDWSIEAIKQGLFEREITVEDTGYLSTCHNCIKGQEKVWCPAEDAYIDSIAWSEKDNTAAFHAAYG